MDIIKNGTIETKTIKTGREGDVLKNRYVKITLYALIFIAVAAVVTVFIWKKKVVLNENLSNVISTDQASLIDKYKQDLVSLKQKAEKSGNAEDLQAYGIAQYAIGDSAGAIATYEKQIEKDPNSIVAHGGLANAMRDQKNFDEAIEQYKKAIELAPNNVSVYANLASVYQYQLKQVDKAIETYKQGIEKNPKSADLYVLISLAYEQTGDIGSAKINYEKAFEIDQSNAAAKAGLERLK